MPQEVIDRVHAIADAQRMPADVIFTDANGTIIDDDGPDIAPPPPPDDDHRSVDPADGLYMGLHNPVQPVADQPGDYQPAQPADYPPEFPIPPAVAGEDHLPNDNYFLPLANPDDDEGVEGDADGLMEVHGDVAPEGGDALRRGFEEDLRAVS